MSDEEEEKAEARSVEEEAFGVQDARDFVQEEAVEAAMDSEPGSDGAYQRRDSGQQSSPRENSAQDALNAGYNEDLDHPHSESQEPALESQDGEAAEARLTGDADEAAPIASVPASLDAMDSYPTYCDPFYRMPTELAVRVERGDGDAEVIVVMVEKCPEGGCKPYLGGYKARATGKTFHHASTQFGSRKRVVKDTSNLRSRDTQTVQLRTVRAQTRRECGTQMERRGLHLSTDADAPCSVGAYVTADEYWARRAACVVTMQRYWRGHAARARVWGLRQRRWQRTVAARQRAAAAAAAEDRAREREARRRRHPRTAADFELLYNELAAWCAAEAARAAELPEGPPRRAAMAALLRKETRLLQTIEGLKRAAARAGAGARVARTLDLMARPKRWELRDGSAARVATEWTARAAELAALYRALAAPLVGAAERLDVLLHVKWAVRGFECRLTRELVELLDREADLLSRGRAARSMAGLRLRACGLFLRFIETPDFNPEASRFLRAPPSHQHLAVAASKQLVGIAC